MELDKVSEQLGKERHQLIFDIIMYIPAFLIMELTAEHRRKYILKFANKLGIKEPLDDPLNIETP